jgi:hypothetical protein
MARTPETSPFVERDDALLKKLQPAPRVHDSQKSDCWQISGRVPPPPSEGEGRNRFEIAQSRRKK